MAHKKSGGSTRNGRDSAGRRLGIKSSDGQLVSGGSIIVRQRGTHFKPGKNCGLGGDDSIYAKVNGRVVFSSLKGRRKLVSVLPV